MIFTTFMHKHAAVTVSRRSRSRISGTSTSISYPPVSVSLFSPIVFRPHSPPYSSSASERAPFTHPSGIHLSDILFALFKRKWTIILCALLGIIAAAGYYFLYPPVYESDARLLVRYVLERSAVDPIDNTNRSNLTGKTTDSIIDAEVQILTSWDLAVQVADAIGPKRLGAPSKEAAAGGIVLALQVTAAKGSDVIFISYKNRSPE